MQAIMYTEYGPPEVLKLNEVEKPVPKDNEILIKVHATTVNFGDLLARNMRVVTPRKFTMPMPLWLPVRLAFGFRKPRKKILGNEYAGEIVDVGKQVTRFKTGDQVFGYRGQAMGAYAEYLTMPEGGMVAHKPVNMSYEEAAVISYGSITALSLLRKANIQAGQRILVNGASGSIGSHAVQIAKNHGAHVTGVCGTPRLAFVSSLGADEVIDYTQEDFTKNGQTYDLIFDVLNKSSFTSVKDSLTPNGRYLLASFGMRQLFQMVRTKVVGRKKVICALSSERPEDLVLVKQMAEEGKLKTVIDRQFPLRLTAEAHRYVEEGHKRGQVVINCVRNDNK